MSKGLGILSLIMGVAFTVIGGTAVLASFGIGLITLPAIIHTVTITKYCLLVGGLFLLFDSMKIRSFHTMRAPLLSMIIGLVVALLGAFPLLLDFGLLTFLPFSIKFTIPAVVLSASLTFFGLWLFINSYKLFESAGMMPTG